MAKHSKVIRSDGYSWKGVPEKKYKDDPGCYEGVKRYSLLGEGEQEHPLNFQTRYFEVEKGGYTSFEYHRHPHSVVIIRGSGSVVIDDAVHDLGLHDVVYIAPDSMHQFHAAKHEPLGFLCVVDRNRDKPVLPDDGEVRARITSDRTLNKIKR